MRDRLLGAREAVGVLLTEFERRSVHATWATVGMLYAPDKRTLLDALPARRPTYLRPELSAYAELDALGEDEARDPFHFAHSLVQRIARTPGQELATHTFSHFYCLEPGQTALEFEDDIAAAQALATRIGVPAARSIVFPRNQLAPSYLDALRRRGVTVYRANPDRWPYHASAGDEETPLRRAARLADAYAPLFRNEGRVVAHDGVVSVPASAFLRPWSRRLQRLDRLRAWRLREAMTHAARTGGTFHLWWHPHNFGADLRENMAFLAHLLDHFEALRREGRMEAATMWEASREASA